MSEPHESLQAPATAATGPLGRRMSLPHPGIRSRGRRPPSRRRVARAPEPSPRPIVPALESAAAAGAHRRIVTPLRRAPVVRSTSARRVAGRIAEEVVAWLKTLASAAVYATLIVTFGFQVARVEGQSMAPTLADQDRLIVNKAAYRFFEEPQIGDIVMLYYPLNPEKSFVKRVIAKEGDQVRIVNGRVYRNDVLDQRRVRADRVSQPRRLGPRRSCPRASTS